MSEKKQNPWIQQKLIPAMGKFASARHMVALRDGFALAMPLIIIGSVFMILSQFPIKPYLDFMTNTFGKNWATTVQFAQQASFGIIGMIAVIGISYQLARSYKDVDPLAASVVALSAFLLTIPLYADKTGALYIPMAQVGATGLFTAMLVGLFMTDLYVWLLHHNVSVKMPDTVPPAVSNAFAALIPGFVVLLVVWGIRIGIGFTAFKTIPNIITVLLTTPLTAVGGSLPGALAAEFFISFLWLFGIHGANVVGGIMAPIWLGQMSANAAAFRAHEAIPNVVSQQFFDNFVHLGGSGATIALAVLIAFFSRSQESKALGKLVIGPAIFNINEPIIFGLPIVLNPATLVPFVLVPLFNVTITYFAMSFGWVAHTIGVQVPWTTPIIFSGYLSTGSISGAVLQVVEVLLDLVIWYPFFRFADNQKLANERKIAAEEAAEKAN